MYTLGMQSNNFGLFRAVNTLWVLVEKVERLKKKSSIQGNVQQLSRVDMVQNYAALQNEWYVLNTSFGGLEGSWWFCKNCRRR